MTGYSGSKAASQYRQLGLEAEIVEASPHRLIQLLFEGALDRILKAEVALERRDIAGLGENTSRAIAILSGLHESLDDTAGELAAQLASLYEYCEVRLLEANRQQNSDMLREVERIVRTLKSGWDGIATESKA